MEEEGSIGDVETFYKDKTVFITGATGFMGKVGNIFWFIAFNAINQNDMGVAIIGDVVVIIVVVVVVVL